MTLVATLSKADIAVTTRYILVDVSNTAYPHAVDEEISLEKLEVAIDKEGTGDWILRVGFVEEVDATDGSVTFFFVRQIRGITSLLELVDYVNIARAKGLSLATANFTAIGSDDVDDSVNWQTDVNLANPTGTDTGPGKGDLVIELEEVDGSATISFTLSAHYSRLSKR